MVLIGFNFTKLCVEKKKSQKGEIKSNANVEVNSIQEAKLSGADGQKGLEFRFRFSLTYVPDIGSTEIEGVVIFMGTQEKVKSILDKWSKKKELDKDVVEEVYNMILHKCNIEALILGQTMGLPVHIRMPKVSAK